MTLPFTRRFIAGSGVALAVWAGWSIANGDMLGVGAILLIAIGFIVYQLLEVRLDALIAGFALFGFLIGNRGFAQLSPPNIPLLPAEAALLAAIAVIGWLSAYRKALPLQHDTLNVALLAWIVLGAIRLPFDVRTFGLMAIRDFATVYYALFLYAAQQWYADEPSRRWIDRCLVAGLIGAPIAFGLFQWIPETVMHFTQLGTVPLIYVKGDSAAALMAGGAAWCGCRGIARRSGAYLLLALALLTTVFLSNSRAALVAILVVVGWLVAARAWKLLGWLAGFCVVGAMIAIAAATFSHRPWQETEVYRTYERFASIADFTGTRNYRSAILQDKGDNNEFRLTWWTIVARETWTDGRWLGLGYGRDLADEFSKVYYPDAEENLTARSPHNIVLSVFARSGIVGLAAFLIVLGVMAVKTWRAGRAGVDERFGLWLFAWAVFVSACFGVVLEGPMGAVVFWTVLGLANARENKAEKAEAPPVVAEQQSIAV